MEQLVFSYTINDFPESWDLNIPFEYESKEEFIFDVLGNPKLLDDLNIITIYDHQIEWGEIFEEEYYKNLDKYVFTLEEWFKEKRRQPKTQQEKQENMKNPPQETQSEQVNIRQRCMSVILKYDPEIQENEILKDWDDLDLCEILMQTELVFGCNINDGDIRIENFEKVSDLVDWLVENVSLSCIHV